MFERTKGARSILLVSLLATALAASPGAMAQQQSGTVRGQIFNRTLNQPAKIERLVLMRAETQLEEEAVLENINGSFEFKNIPLASTETRFFLRAFHQGVNYHSNVSFSTGLSQTVNVDVYETTRSSENLVMSVPHLIVVKTGDLLKFDETVNVGNTGQRTVASSDPNRPTFIFSVPEDHNEITRVSVTYADNIPLNQTPIQVGDLYGLNFPLRPGVTQITYTYTVPYGSSGYTFRKDLQNDIESFILAASPADMKVETQDLEFSGTDENLDMTFFRQEKLTKGKTIEMHFSGGSASRLDQPSEHNHGNSQIVAVPNETMRYVWVVTPLLASLFTFGLYMALSRKPAEKKPKKSRARR